jgi:hypothetical protein
VLVKEGNQVSVESIEKLIDEQKIAVALGAVSLICIHFAKALNINLQNIIIFNGHRSMIHSKETLDKRAQPYRLFIYPKGERSQLIKSLPLLE